MNSAAVKMLGFESKADIEGRLQVSDFSPDIQPSGRPTLDISMELYGLMLQGQQGMAEYWHYDTQGNLFPVMVKVQVRRGFRVSTHLDG